MNKEPYKQLTAYTDETPVIASDSSQMIEPTTTILGDFRLTYEVINGVGQLKVILINGAITISPKTSNSVIIGHKYK